jgi:hypothetical protein
MIDKRHLELIQGEIDGENSAADSEALRQELASNPEYRAIYDDLKRVSGFLQQAKPVEPPAGLREQIIRAVAPARLAGPARHRPDPVPAGSGWLSWLNPRYAAAFAMGLLVAFGAVSLQKFSDGAGMDTTQLVGTMARPAGSESAPGNHIKLALDGLAGSVNLDRQGPYLVVEFDLDSARTAEMVAVFEGAGTGFSGLVQRRGEASSIAAGGREITVSGGGEQQYALLLNNPDNGAVSVDLKFFVEGSLVHEAGLEYAGSE